MNRYPIRTVAQMTGLSTALIRAWESRYGMVTPERSESGYRLYSDEDVALFLGAHRLVQKGMAPMQVAQLPRSQLLAEAGKSAAPPPSKLTPMDYGELIEAAVAAFNSFDRQRAEELLALPLLLHPPAVACQEFLAPLLREVGDRWHRGELSVAAEHFGTELMRAKLLAILETLGARQSAQRVLCISPPDELHDVGLLMFAIEAASQGYSPIYLGANVPLEALASAAHKSRPELAAASLILRREAGELLRVLRAMKAAVGKDCPLIVGGRAVHGCEKLVYESGCLSMPASGKLQDLQLMVKRRD